ncbi:MAG: Zn-ribbon domain-containing OB-fold protein [Sphingobium sp.]
MHSTAPLAVADGLFSIDGGAVRLVGTRCLSCNSAYFPQTVSCRNPDCRDKNIEECRLSPKGVLYSWTRQQYQPPTPFRMDDWKPYLIGLVDLPEGLRVLGMLDMGEEEAAIGMAVRVECLALHADSDGATRHTYCFVPADQPEPQP